MSNQMRFFCLILLFLFSTALFSQSFEEEIQNYKTKRQADSLYNLAIRATKINDYKGSIGYLEQIPLVAPNYVPGYLLKGKILFYLDRKDEAQFEFQQVVTIDPSNGEGYFLVAYSKFVVDTHAV